MSIVAGGDHKTLGDGRIVVIRPETTLGNSDIWDMRDVVTAIIEMQNGVKGALAGAATFADFKTAVAALPNLVEFRDHAGL
jgi:hypothetical protein